MVRTALLPARQEAQRVTAAGVRRGRLLPSTLEAAEQSSPLGEAGVGMPASGLPVPSRAAPLLGALSRVGAAAMLLVCGALGWMPPGEGASAGLRARGRESRSQILFGNKYI